MRLLDRVAQTRFASTLPTKAGELPLSAPDELRRKLIDAPLRYVLADDVAAFCLRVMAEEPDFLLATRDLVRAPAPLLWVEWNDTICRRLLSELGLIAGIDPQNAHTRAGILVESAEGGRQGRIRSIWSRVDEDGACEVSPFAIEFDFDAPQNRLQARAANDEIGVFLHDAEALDGLLGCTRFHLLAPWGEWARITYPGAELADLFKPIFAELSSDFPFFWAFLIALGAQNAVEKRDIEYGQLNRTRLKRGKPALLAHVEVNARFGKNKTEGDDAALGETSRDSPRLHFVRGHLVRRADVVFWRSPHMRGSAQRGEVQSRTVHLALGRERRSIRGM
jgi:hypothetical protein